MNKIHFNTEEHSKMDENWKICTRAAAWWAPAPKLCAPKQDTTSLLPHAPLRPSSCAFDMVYGEGLLIACFQVVFVENAQFSFLNP